MSVDDAIKSYGALAGRVFSDVNVVGGDGKFKTSKMETVIKEIVKEQTGHEDEPMMAAPPQGEGCKT